MKFLASLAVSLIFSLAVLAQAKPVSKTAAKPKTVTKIAAKPKTSTKGKPSTKGKKSSANSKKLSTSGEMEFEEVICYEDGPCTFTIIKKDTLVYEVNAAGQQYNLMVIPNKFDPAAIADFNWKTSAPDNKSGHVVINSQGLNNGRKYLLNLPAGELKLSDASTFWLSGQSFKEIAKGETTLAIDNGETEIFKSPAADAVSTDIVYKGKPLSIEGFALQNKAEGEPGRKELWVMNVSNNLLLIKLDNGSWSMRLKEVREKK
jgi:hypothetical protein